MYPQMNLEPQHPEIVSVLVRVSTGHWGQQLPSGSQRFPGFFFISSSSCGCRQHSISPLLRVETNPRWLSSICCHFSLKRYESSPTPCNWQMVIFFLFREEISGSAVRSVGWCGGEAGDYDTTAGWSLTASSSCLPCCI